MQIRAKSTIKSFHDFRKLVYALALLIVLIESQSDFSSKTFPDRLPMRINESLSINLNQYFEGNNMSFTVLPSSTKSYVDQIFQCRDIAYHNLGKVIASQYYKRSDSEILALLTQSLLQANKYEFHHIQVDKTTLTTFNITVTKIANCSAFLLEFINQTHFEVTVDCNYTAEKYTSALVSAILDLNTYKPEWTLTLTPLFTYSKISQIQLSINKDLVFRGIFSPTNSYIQVWSWGDDQRFIIGLIDKAYLQLDIFNMKKMKLYGKSLIILDFMHGLYVVRFGNSKKFSLIAHFQQPFYNGFEYDEVTGMLLLYKKGKVDTIILQNTQNQELYVGKSYNLQEYQDISKIIQSQNKIIALSSQYIHLFIQTGDSFYLNYNFYSIQNIINIFARVLSNQPLTLLTLYNKQEVVSYSSCIVKTPLLHLTPPDEPQLITVIGQSTINGDSTFSRQSFQVEKLQQQRDLIYDNGYQADNEIIFANLPGESILAMNRYGVGNNLSYKVVQSQTSKIQYESSINKLSKIECSIVTKPLPLGGSLYLSITWQQLLITQFTSDFSMRYFFCSQAENISCVPAYEQFSLQPISNYAYELIEIAEDLSVSYQALVQQSKGDVDILVRKLLVIETGKQLLVSKYCNIKLPNRAEEYYNITQMQIADGKLYVLLRYRKQIRIYSLSDPTCSNIANITVQSFPGEYFSPNRIYLTSLDANKQALLRIRQWNQILTIRLRGSNLNSPIILSRTSLPEVAKGSVVLSQAYLVYLSLANNKAQCYKFDDSGQLQYLRQLDFQGMIMVQMNKQEDYYYKLLDSTHLAIFLMNNRTKEIIVKVFAFTELISSTSDYLYARIEKDDQMVIFLKGYQPESRFLMSIQIRNGPALSYFFCRSNKINLLPSIKFNFKKAYYPVQNYIQNVTVLLQTAEDLHAHHFRISLSNIGTGISKGSRFPGRGTAIQSTTELIIDDKFWFSGSVYNFSVDCKDCNTRITFTQKATLQKHQPLPFTSKMFLEQKGNIISFLDQQFIIRLEQNYSPWPIDSTNPGYQLKQIQAVSLNPSECIDSKLALSSIISLCYRLTINDQKQYYLSLASTISFKGFILDQIIMQFQPIVEPKLLLVDNIIIVYSSKAAIIYTVWDFQDSTRFIQLDRIDSQDIASTISTLELISNNTSPYIDITKLTYTVVLTQSNSQIYYCPFFVYLQQQQIVDQKGENSIITYPNIYAKPQIINLIKVWTQRHIQIPSDAKIMQTITRKQQSSFEEQEILSIIVIFDKFHSYRFRIVLSKLSKITKGTTLQAVYYKFGSNIAFSAALDDYLVIKYLAQTDSTTNQVYGCFDLNYFTYNAQQIKQHYSYAAYTLPFSKESLTSESQSWYLIGNKIFYIYKNAIQYLVINNKLVGRISGLQPSNSSDLVPLYTQKMVIYNHNPIDSKSATIQLNAVDIIQLSGLQIALIVVGSLILAIVSIVLGRVLVKKIKKRMKLVQLVENERAEQALLEIQDQEKVDNNYEINESLAEGIVNQTDRGSVQP